MGRVGIHSKLGLEPRDSNWLALCSCTPSVHEWEVLWASQRQEAPRLSLERKQSHQMRGRGYSGMRGNHGVAAFSKVQL